MKEPDLSNETNSEDADGDERSASADAAGGKPPTSSRTEPGTFSLVGIGASAGGIAALHAFFQDVPEETGIVFVVVMHLSPEHESNLAQVLQPHVRIPVLQVQGRTEMKSDHVYVIPPGHSLSVTDEHLELAEFAAPRGHRAPIDIFFRTVADAHPDGVGVLLSGAGTDGVVGMKAIKEKGGVLLVQSPDEAEYDVMPRAAAATGLVDFVLPARELGAKVVELRSTGISWSRPGSAEDLGAGVVATFTEITAIRRAQERLRRSEERLRLLVESVKEYAIFSVDLGGRITLWNAGAERIFGFTEDDAIGEPIARIFTREDREAGAPEQEMRRAAQTGQSMDERWHLRRDGSRFWASGTLTALYDPAGELRGLAKVLRDQTERREREEALRRSEERLRRLNETLEDRVAERTAELERAQERSRRLAAEVVLAEQRGRRRVARQLHDDLQQRLYALQMKMPLIRTLVERGDLAAMQRKLVELEAWVGGAVQIARQITVDLSPRTLRGEGFRESLDWLVEQMGELHGLEVEVRAERPYEIQDEDLRTVLFQSVRELLFNVVKHAGTSRATVEIGRDEAGCLVRVVDEGRGFDVSALAEEDRRGEGFGIHTVRERIRLLEGELDIETAPGEGTRITIRLPESGAEPSGADEADE